MKGGVDHGCSDSRAAMGLVDDNGAEVDGAFGRVAPWG